MRTPHAATLATVSRDGLYRSTENALRYNDGPSKSQGVKMQNMKMQDTKMQDLKMLQ